MLRRGFKAESNWISRDVRRSLGVAPEAAICPFALAAHLEVVVCALTEFADRAGDAVSHFALPLNQGSFSAVTLHIGGGRVIVHNDFHHPKRQAANLAHELAHALLHHPAAPPLNDLGQRVYEDRLEDEANWLGPALLISEEAALWIVEQNLSDRDAADYFGVSQAVVVMRLKVTAARQRLDARRRKAA